MFLIEACILAHRMSNPLLKLVKQAMGHNDSFDLTLFVAVCFLGPDFAAL